MLGDPQPLSDIERDRIRRVLETAGFPPNEVAWMVESCPGVDVALEYYGAERGTEGG